MKLRSSRRAKWSTHRTHIAPTLQLSRVLCWHTQVTAEPTKLNELSNSATRELQVHSSSASVLTLQIIFAAT